MAHPRKNTVLETNMKVLKQRHPAAWKAVSAESGSDGEGEVVFSESGAPNILVKQEDGISFPLHDADEPGRECRPFINQMPEDFHGTVLVFGMGMGYAATSFLETKKKLQHLIIFELDIAFFKLALAHADLETVLGDDRVILSLGEVEDVDDILTPAKRALMLEDIHTHKLISCFRYNPAYETLASKVFDHVSALNIDGATRSHHGKTFIDNRLRHLTSMHHDRKLEDLADRYKGVPALMVAAGPSLDKNIDQIAKAVGKALIIAVDTALPVLLDKGIVPDFVTSIDFNDPIYEKIASVASQPVAREINLICTSWVACTVTKIFPAKCIFWAFGSNAFEDWMKEMVGGKLTIGGAGTVAHLNYVAANVMGCDPLIFVGQDLAHSYDREHASNVVFTGTETMEKVLKDAVWVKGVTTETVPTTRSLHGYRVLFEQWIPGTDARVVNATEGGAWIEGAEHMSLEQAIETFCGPSVNAVPDMTEGQEPKTRAAMESMLKRVNRAEKIINKADRLGRTLLKELSQLQSAGKKIFALSTMPNKLRKKIIELDGYHNKADRDSLWEIFDEMTMEGLKQNEREKKELDRLEGKPEHYLEWLLKSVERLNRVNSIRKENLGQFQGQLKTLIAFHHREHKLLAELGRKETPGSCLIELLSLYYDNGDYTLLSEAMAQYDGYEAPEIDFYAGVIALYRGHYERAERHFERCLSRDGAFAGRIRSKRRDMAEYYYEWGKTLPLKSLHALEDKSGIYLRMKGLKMYPGHEGICAEFKALAEKELARLASAVESGGVGVLQENEACLRAWVEFFDEKEAGMMGFTGQMMVSFYRYLGKVLLDTNKAEEALALFKNAMTRLPDRPELCISAADICFSTNAFDQGLDYLRQAVAQDKGYAVYWQNMGDNLSARGDFSGAILAYTEAVTALPHRTEFWEKIGNCHKSLGNEEAAREAFDRHQSSGE